MCKLLEMEGSLFKELHRQNYVLWTKVYVVLDGLFFNCYHTRTDAELNKPFTSINLKDVALFLEERRDSSRTKYCIRLRSKGNGFQGQLVLATSEEEERNRWISAILRTVCQIMVIQK